LKNLPFDDAIVQSFVSNNTIELLVKAGEGSIRPDSLIADWCGVAHPLAVATIVKTAVYYVEDGVIKEFQ